MLVNTRPCISNFIPEAEADQKFIVKMRLDLQKDIREIYQLSQFNNEGAAQLGEILGGFLHYTGSATKR